MARKTLQINVPALARVEGEGALDLRIEDGSITDLRLRIYEPPRFFEKFLEGRSHQDVIDSVARICGICPVAYQMSAVQAIESVFGIVPSQWVRDMRRVMYCGEWIQSHSLHVHMLAAPDFLGCTSVIEMAREHDAEVRRGLRLQELGNDLIALFGGRSVHPVGVCAGGFFKAPSQVSVSAIARRLEEAWEDTDDLIRWTASLDFPDDEQGFTCVALRNDDEYAINSGRIVSDRGLDLPIEDYQSRFAEHQAPHSTALHSLLDGEPYLVGPLARINLNLDQLPAAVIAPLAGLSVDFPSRNMFHSIVARAIEIRLAIHEALEILRGYAMPDEPRASVEPAPGVGFGCTEAPRGLLWHRYELDDRGHVVSADIVPPTSQNQARIEQDLRDSIQTFGLEQPAEDLRLHAETVIRNYDPCISCSTHFLKMNIDTDTRAGKAEGLVVAKEGPGAAASMGSAGQMKVIAIGSPEGADCLAWKVLERLQEQGSGEPGTGCSIECLSLDRPGAALLHHLRGDVPVVLLDAIVSDRHRGKVLELHGNFAASAQDASLVSGHDLGVLDALRLGAELGELPDGVRLLGLCIGSNESQTSPDSRQVECFVRELQSRLGGDPVSMTPGP